MDRLSIAHTRPVSNLLARLGSPIAITACLLIPLICLRVVLLVERRVPMGHDTFQYLHLQYVFFNEAVLHGRLPQWLPFMTQGTVSNVWILVSQGIVASTVSFVARFLKDVNYLYIFQAGLLFDEFALLLGSVLLARRYLTTWPAVVFVATSVTYTAITSAQPWYDFHFFYLLPLILYCLDRAIRDVSSLHLLMAGLFLAATLLGNLPYLLPVTAFAIALFWTAVSFFAPGPTHEVFRAFYRRRSWHHLVAFLVPLALTVAFGLYLKTGWAEISASNIGRGPRGEVTSVAEFLTYGGSVDFGKFSALVARFSNNLDNTIYAGLLILPFALVAALARTSPVSYAFGGTALALALFGAGTTISVAFYYLFPLGSYFRHIGLTATVAKVFLIFFAGFGFDAFWQTVAKSRTAAWSDWTPVDRRVVLIPVLTMIVIVASFLLQGVAGVTVYRFPPWGPLTRNQLYLDLNQVTEAIRWQLALGSALMIVLLVAVLLSIRRSRWAVVAAGFLLALHVGDALSVKAELERERIPRVEDPVVQLFRPHRYQYATERSQDYGANGRFTFLAPSMLGVARLQDLGRTPHSGIGPYGALYWSVESFVFLDAAASVFRTDHWLNSIDAFYSVWVPPTIRLPRHLGLPVPQSLTYARLSGFGYPKLQVFSSVHVLPTDRDIAAVLADRGFGGDVLLVASKDAPVSGNGTPGIVESKRGPPRGANTRRKVAAISVEEFSFDSLKVRVTVDAAAVLYYADAWHPRWLALVNGNPSPVIRTNLGYKSVPVPRGTSEVLFRFRDVSTGILLRIIQVTGLLALLAVFYLGATDARSTAAVTAAAIAAGPAGSGLPVGRRQLGGRVATIFGATFLFWWLYARERFTDVVLPLVQLVDPTSTFLVTTAVMLIATLTSFLIALLMARLSTDSYRRGALITGLLVDIAGLLFMGWNSGPVLPAVVLHIIATTVILAQNRQQLATFAGVMMLAYGWTGERINVCRVPGPVAAVQHDATKPAVTALVRHSLGFKRYPVPHSCFGPQSELIAKLMEENYYGYNIIRLSQRFYGIRKTDGPFNLDQFAAGRYHDAVAGESVAAVKRLIVELGLGEAHLIEENYRGFNLVEYGQRYHGIPQGQGQFDGRLLKRGDYSMSFDAATMAEVKRQIDAALRRGETPGPSLVEQGYRGFNIIQFGPRYYAIPQSEGAFEIQRVRTRGYTRSFVEGSASAVKKLVDQALAPTR